MDKNDNIVMISKDIRANERYIRERLADCGDIQIRKMRLGDERKVDCLMVYIEVATSNMMLEDSAIGKMVGHFWGTITKILRMRALMSLDSMVLMIRRPQDDT